MNRFESEKTKLLAWYDGSTPQRPVSDWWDEEAIVEVQGTIIHCAMCIDGQMHRDVIRDVIDLVRIQWLDNEQFELVMEKLGNRS